MLEEDKSVDLDADIKPKRIKLDDELDMTPMIDMTFLLIAFFVVASKLDPQAAVELPEARYGLAVPEKNCVVFIVTEGDSPDNANIYKGRTRESSALIRPGEAIDRENEIGDYVDSQLSKFPTLQGVLIKAEGNVRTGAVENVRRGIAYSELARTRKIYVAVEEGQ
jgi:biopolymer transport protein TolR